MEATQLQKCSKKICPKHFQGIMMHPLVFSARYKSCSRRSGKKFSNLKLKWIVSEINIPGKKQKQKNKIKQKKPQTKNQTNKWKKKTKQNKKPPKTKTNQNKKKNTLKILCCKEICYSLVFVNLMSYLCKTKQFLDMHHNIKCSSRDAHFQLQLFIKK